MTISPVRKALYRLDLYPASFDFFPWLVMQAHAGATEVVFDTARVKIYKWDLPTTMRRFESILLPGPALLGMAHSIGTEGQQFAPFHQYELVRLYNEGMRFPRLRSVLPPGKARYTVTLRKTQRVPRRNSNEHAWRRFADDIGAHVIPDYSVRPISLHERMALYAGAEMNFFSTNGPSMLCFLGTAPGMMFGCHLSPMVKMGVPLGQGYPFLLPQHKQVYEPDEYDVIRKHYKQWRREKDEAASRGVAT